MIDRVLPKGVRWVGVLDRDRRTFDELIPLPDGTTYNAYLVTGAEKTALIDTVDPAFTTVLLERLEQEGVKRLDYAVSNHAEQDHSGSLPAVLERVPEAKVVSTPKGRGILSDLLGIAGDRFLPVEDGASLPLGAKTLRFLHFPWAHWPETMVTWLEEDRVLFSCDLFGAHLATAEMVAPGDSAVPAARSYYAEIMMPYRRVIGGNLARVTGLDVDLICPSHGPVLPQPRAVLRAYRAWLLDPPQNRAVIAYVSMHDSTRRMARHLADALALRGVAVDLFDLAQTDLGELASALVDAATIVFGSPTFVAGAHPLVANAAQLIGLLKPKARFAAIFGSYSWGGKMASQISALIQNLELELLEPVVAKGLPKAADLEALEGLADAIAAKHAGL